MHGLNYFREEAILIPRNKTLVLGVVFLGVVAHETFNGRAIARSILVPDLIELFLNVILFVFNATLLLALLICGQSFYSEQGSLFLFKAERSRDFIIRVYFILLED